MSFKNDYKSAFGSVSPDTDKIIAGVHEKLNENAPLKLRTYHNSQRKKPVWAVIGSVAGAAACIALAVTVAVRVVPNIAMDEMNGVAAPECTDMNNAFNNTADNDGNYHETENNNDNTGNDPEDVNSRFPSTESSEGLAETSSSGNEISNNYVYFEDFEYEDFTEDDLWLQSFLKENYPMALFLYRTLHDNIYEPEYEYNTDAEHKSQYILEYKGTEIPYFIVPNTYFNNFDELNALYQQYFSSSSIEDYRAYADVVDTENNRIVLRDYSEPFDYPSLIEINGRLYHVASGPSNRQLPCPGMMAKVMTRTEDEIVFSYLCYVDGIGNAMPGKGVLEKENGVWKFGWSLIVYPIEFQDIHEVWGV